MWHNFKQPNLRTNKTFFLDIGKHIQQQSVYSISNHGAS